MKHRTIDIVEYITISAMILMIFIVALQITARYILKISIPWTEEAARYMLILITFLGAAVSLARDEHIRINVLLERIPPKKRGYLQLIYDIAIALFLALVFRGSLKMIHLTWETPAGTIGWITTGKIYLILPFSIIIMICVLMFQIYHRVKDIVGQLFPREE